MVKNVKFFSQVDLESGIASLAVFLFGEGEVKTSFLGEERVVHLKEEGVREDYFILEVTTLPPKGRELPESYSQELFLFLRRWAS